MTLTSLILILAVALVNLSLGFGAAALVGRGPWSSRARLLRCVATELSSAETAGNLPTDQHDVVSAPSDAAAMSANTSEPTEVAEPTQSTTHNPTSQTMQRLLSGIESLEHQLLSLQQLIQSCVDAQQKQMLPQWAASMVTVANELGELDDEFHRRAVQDQMSDEARQSTAGFLASLQPIVQEAVVAVGQRGINLAARSAYVERLMTACQEARGAITAASFIQSQG